MPGNLTPLIKKHSLGLVRLAVILLILFGIYTQRDRVAGSLSYSFCDTPVQYKIGTVDKGFNLTEAEFAVAVADGAAVWNNSAGKTLFTKSDQAQLTVNLIYDKRQGLHNQLTDLEQNLDKNQSNLDKEIAEYEALKASFQERLNAFNDQVRSWNDQGGAPSGEFERLNQEQKTLKDEAQRLNDMARRLNRETDSYNNQVSNLNQTIDTFSTTLKQRPEEGLFLPSENRIEIYFNITRKELIHTTAHEFGHSLGLGHVEKNPQAIMYPLTSDSLQLSAEDRFLLNNYCQKRNRLVDGAQGLWFRLLNLKMILQQRLAT
jgi:myosin heavy subunit